MTSSMPNMHQANTFDLYNRETASPPPAPPVRDSSTLKSIKYGPGHEKFPSWPVASTAEAPQVLRTAQSSGSYRSKSWTDHTNYPKEKVVTYTRPYMKRAHSSQTQQKLKTVMERCEKISAATFEARLYYPHVDRDGKQLGDADYMVPSPPERDSYKLDDEDFMQYNLDHQKQLPYERSEGYHSYVSSSDLSSSTPFLDQLRRDSESFASRQHCYEGRDSVVTTSSGSASSSETLKWHGSMSDVSVASSSSSHLKSKKQLIAHSARVPTPQRHYSEGLLQQHEEWKDKESKNNNTNALKLFPVNTYIVQDNKRASSNSRLSTSLSISVADKVNELEKQKYSYLNPDKKHKIPDPALKAIQKKALLSFYERHHSNKSLISDPHEAAPQLPQKNRLPTRRASSASDYLANKGLKRNSFVWSRDHHSIGPLIVGPSISLDDWVPAKPPERPPKNPYLRNAYPDLFCNERVPSPDLPPPSPPTVLDEEVFHSDEPLPPPPPDLDTPTWSNDTPKPKNESYKMHTVGVPQKSMARASVGSNLREKMVPVSVVVSENIEKGPLRSKALSLSSTKLTTSKLQKRASFAESIRDNPPPALQPRQMRINQSMKFKVSDNHSSSANDGRVSSRTATSNLPSFPKTSMFSKKGRDVMALDTGVYKRTVSPMGRSDKINKFCKTTPDIQYDSLSVTISKDTSEMREKKEISLAQVILPDVLPCTYISNAKSSSRFSLAKEEAIKLPMTHETSPLELPTICSVLPETVNKSPSPETDEFTKFQEDIDCEKLTNDFLSKLPKSEKLKDILVQGPEHKKTIDYVTGLFKLDIAPRPKTTVSPFNPSRTNSPCSSPPLASALGAASSGPIVTPRFHPVSPLSLTSPYFTTSEPKARFLTRYSQDMNHFKIVKDAKDLSQKKEELVYRLDRKLEVLRSEQLLVLEEFRINEQLGQNVEQHVRKMARPNEASKFRLHVEEIGKITSLLLSLSGRLARAENALMSMSGDHPETCILESKRDKLLEQLEEAKKLKESIDKRSNNVSLILLKYLNSEEYADYDHFINMKAKLIMDSKEIGDKIKLGEEQLVALKETLIFEI